MLILAAHMLGDFLLQTDWMADNKKCDLLALSVHVTIYTFCQAIAFHFMAFNNPDMRSFAIPAMSLIWLSHFVVDTVDFQKGHKWAQRGFWLDQSWHILTLVVIYYLAGAIF